jgi:predicted ArsR family transcriptional regulator
MDRQFFASTRGRIVLLLRRAGRTVDELAAALRLTDNAVRGHIATLERDGLVERQGERRGVSKPAHAYALAPAAERLFPKAYAATLGQLLGVLRERLPEAEREETLRVVGRRLAAHEVPPEGDLDVRLAHAAGVLNRLGGLVEVERFPDSFVIQGYDCPLAAVAVEHPDVCIVAAELLTELAGVPVREHCERGTRPRCRFEGHLRRIADSTS